MTSVPDGADAAAGLGGDRGADEAHLPLVPLEPPEPAMPLLELDRALAPVRRMVRFATSTRAPPDVRYLGANLARHAARAGALALPTELRERIEALHAELAAFDADGPAGKRERLARMYAELARIDGLAGLPVRAELRPVPKIHQIDLPEPEGEAADPRDPPRAETPAPAARDRGRSRRSAPPAAEPRDRDPAVDPDDEDDGEQEEFAGDLLQPLSELLTEDLVLAFAAVGIETVGDLLDRRPTGADVLTTVHGAGRQLPEGLVAVGGRVRSAFSVLRPSGAAERWSVVVGAGAVRVRWADPPPDGWRSEGRKIVVAGLSAGGAVADAEAVVPDEGVVRLATWGLPNLPDRAVRHVIGSLSEGLASVRDPVAPEALRALGLAPLGAAYALAHLQAAEAGRRRLAFDEALLAQIAGVLPRMAPGRERGIGHTVTHAFAGRLGTIHDLVLYDDAQAHLEEIKRDLRRQSPMRRVLTGEVGAGKGLIGLVAASMVADAKSQVLVLGTDPHEVENRFLHSEQLLRDGGIVPRLVPSAPTRAQLDAIKRGEIHVVFSTIGLLEQPIEYRRLGLVIATEREAFGRASALHTSLPAPRPDLLVTTAIPVGPRLLLTAYADHQVSVVVDPGRRPARIELCKAEDRAHAYAAIVEAVRDGCQGLILFPLVEGSDALDLPSALRLLRVMEAESLPNVRLGLLHGAMPPQERLRVFDDLIHRRIDVLVSTARIEDGPPIPAAAIAVIEQADRVEQWRLHRIIGFLSRSGGRPLVDPEPNGPQRAVARAILVVGELAERDAAARIERVVNAPNGFQLTESLVQLHGVAAAVASGAAPLPRFGWFDPDRDLDLLLAAREEAHRILRADPSMRRGGHLDLGRELRARWDRLFPDAEAQGFVCLLRDEGPAEPRRRRRRRRRRGR